jgi:hypothetical protein
MSLQEWAGGILIIIAAYGVARATVNDEKNEFYEE